MWHSEAKLALPGRTYACVACDLVLDHNAARNPAALAADTGELRRSPMEAMSDRSHTRVRQSHRHAMGRVFQDPTSPP
jgi:hypothetical protein